MLCAVYIGLTDCFTEGRLLPVLVNYVVKDEIASLLVKCVCAHALARVHQLLFMVESVVEFTEHAHKFKFISLGIRN